MAIGDKKTFDTTGIQLTGDACVVIVKTEWNSHVVDKLEEGCISVLSSHHIPYKVLIVPGAFEIPFAIKNHWQKANDLNCLPSAYIALGCVIKGDTPHFEYVCNAVTDGILHLNLQLSVPVIFGVLTVNTQAQADERIGGEHGHKGEEAASTALKMVVLSQSMPSM
jgi:6,7-dimethyl-8-ribityllumazine synthase